MIRLFIQNESNLFRNSTFLQKEEKKIFYSSLYF